MSTCEHCDMAHGGHRGICPNHPGNVILRMQKNCPHGVPGSQVCNACSDEMATACDLARARDEIEQLRAERDAAQRSERLILAQAQESQARYDASARERNALLVALRQIIDVGIGDIGVDCGRGGGPCRYCEDKNEIAEKGLGL